MKYRSKEEIFAFQYTGNFGLAIEFLEDHDIDGLFYTDMQGNTCLNLRYGYGVEDEYFIKEKDYIVCTEYTIFVLSEVEFLQKYEPILN